MEWNGILFLQWGIDVAAVDIPCFSCLDDTDEMEKGWKGVKVQYVQSGEEEERWWRVQG